MTYDMDKRIHISYDELVPNKGYPSLKDNIQHERYENQENIARYLRNATEEFMRWSISKDIFTGKPIPNTYSFMSDGVFWWSIVLAYYVEKYNLRLPKEFEEHILRNINK